MSPAGMMAAVRRAAVWLAGRRAIRQERPLRRFVPLFLAVWLTLAVLPGAPRAMTEMSGGAAALCLLAGVA